MECGPKQKVGSGIPEWCVLQTQPAHTTFSAQRVGPRSWQTNIAPSKGRTGVLIEGRCTDVGSTHDPPGTAKRKTNNPRYQECRQWEETSAHKPSDTEGGHGEPKQVHTSPEMQRLAWGAETSAHKPVTQRVNLGNSESNAHNPATQRVSLGGWGKPTQVAVMQKDPQKHLPSKFRPAAQGGTGEQNHQQWSQRQAGDW